MTSYICGPAPVSRSTRQVKLLGAVYPTPAGGLPEQSLEVFRGVSIGPWDIGDGCIVCICFVYITDICICHVLLYIYIRIYIYIYI